MARETDERADSGDPRRHWRPRSATTESRWWPMSSYRLASHYRLSRRINPSAFSAGNRIPGRRCLNHRTGRHMPGLPSRPSVTLLISAATRLTPGPGIRWSDRFGHPPGIGTAHSSAFSGGSEPNPTSNDRTVNVNFRIAHLPCGPREAGGGHACEGRLPPGREETGSAPLKPLRSRTVTEPRGEGWQRTRRRSCDRARRRRLRAGSSPPNPVSSVTHWSACPRDVMMLEPCVAEQQRSRVILAVAAITSR